VEHLNDYTLVELKSPSDTLRAGDFQTLLAYALLYRAQNQPQIDQCRLTLIVIAPRLSGPYAAELHLLGVTARQEEVGLAAGRRGAGRPSSLAAGNGRAHHPGASRPGGSRSGIRPPSGADR
jgi:hypothetical protein